MLRAVLARATFAVVLIGTLLAPFGTCLTMNQKAAHRCCMPASDSGKAVQPNCCMANAPLPAAVVNPGLPSSTPMAVVQAFIPADELALLREVITTAFLHPQSPPVGAFNLRI